MAEKWRMIRVRESTYLRVEEARARMQRAYEAGKLVTVDPANSGRISFDTAVFLLADREARHDLRRKRHACKKRKGKQTSGGSGPPAG